MHELKKIKVADTTINPYSTDAQEEDNIFSKFKQIPISFVESLLNDTSSLDEALMNNIISAELLIKFSKPRKVSNDDYQRIMGAYLKPIADIENVTLYPKKGAPIHGENIYNIKIVSIETTESGKISEEQLYQEMERFLIELENE